MSAHPSLLRAHAHVCVCILIAMFTAAWAPRAGAIPTAPGFVVSVYDSVPDVEDMVFGTDGALYVGRDNSGSGGGNADSVKIHRIVPGGGSHTTWGTRATWDPDAVGFDAAGLVTGVAGSVIVGGRPPVPPPVW